MAPRGLPPVVVVTRGLDLPLAGEPARQVEDAPPVRRVALLAVDHPSLRPRVQVSEGEEVLRGQPLFVDREEPSIRFTSPGAGRVAAVCRGERRRLLSVVVELGEGDLDPSAEAPQVELESYRGPGLDGASGDDVEALLLESGLWTALRTRPFGKVPRPGTAPSSLFVTAMDTSPHAPDLDVALDGLGAELAAGLAALVALGRGAPVRFCVRPGSLLASTDVPGVSVHRFAGPHPAGLPGLHINRLDPVGRGRVCWYVGAQDVVAVGSLVLTGRLRVERVISLSGEPLGRPRMLRTRVGASTGDLVEGQVVGAGAVRVLSGSVLDGRAAEAPELAYLGRYHQQVSVLRDEGRRPLLGWMAPRLRETVGLDPLLSRLFRLPRLRMTTQMHGEPRPLVPIGRYERCMPYVDIPPPLLFRALLTRDSERAEALGALELEEEDLALCSFVCPSKIDFGHHLRVVLDQLEKEGG